MKNSFKSNKGISVIALMITVFMIIVLASIAIASILASENTRRSVYVAQYEQIKKELENKKTPKEEIQLAVVNAIGDSGFDIEKAELVLKEKLIQDQLEDFTVNKEKKEITCTYRGENFRINEFGKVEIVEKTSEQDK